MCFFVGRKGIVHCNIIEVRLDGTFRHTDGSSSTENYLTRVRVECTGIVHCGEIEVALNGNF